MRRYEERINQYQKNSLFCINQRKVFQELNGNKEEQADPDSTEAKTFRSGLWDQSMQHNGQVEGLGEVRNELKYVQERTSRLMSR